MFGFEVYYRHLVPEEKAADLDVPWLELVAEDILEFKPRVPFRGSQSECLCMDCQQLLVAVKEREARDAQRSEKTKKYVDEVMHVRQVWEGIMQAARQTDAEQREAREGRSRKGQRRVSTQSRR